MQIILLKDVEKLGLRGEIVDVKRGYARNYLLPRRLAEVATPGRVVELQRIESHRARHEARSAEQATEIASRATRGALRRAGHRDRGAARQDRAPLRGESR